MGRPHPRDCAHDKIIIEVENFAALIKTPSAKEADGSVPIADATPIFYTSWIANARVQKTMTPIAVDDVDIAAPSFRALTEKQRAFVLALIRRGSGRGKRSLCAKEAGYKGDAGQLAVKAHQLFHDPKIQQALHDATVAYLGSFQLFAIEGICRLAETATKEEVKLKALLAILDRTGFATVRQLHVTKEDVNQTREQRIAAMTAMCVKNPKLLEVLSPAIRTLVESRMNSVLAVTVTPPSVSWG